VNYAEDWKLWLAIVWICTLAEGVWFTIVGSLVITHPPLSFCLLLVLWLAVVVGLVSFNRQPTVLLFASLANLIGCPIIKGIAGGFPDSVWRIVYGHSLDILLFLFSCMAFRSFRRQYLVEWPGTNVPL
jgi:hypothetical protein